MHRVIEYYVNLVRVAKKSKCCFSTHSVHHCMQTIYGGNTKTCLSKLHVAYNNIFRMICDEPKRCSAMFFLPDVASVPDVNPQILILNGIARIQRYNNVIIRNIARLIHHLRPILRDIGI